MKPAADLLWRLFPPLTYASRSMVVSAVLEPCYDVGGDAFDYAVDGTAHLAIYDASARACGRARSAAVLGAVRSTRASPPGWPRWRWPSTRRSARSSPTPVS